MIPAGWHVPAVCARSHYPGSTLANTAIPAQQRPLPRLPSPPVRTAAERRELLKAVYEEARGCTRCPLHQTRTTVVFGAGNADADLMFIGEAPGANEDRMGLPFVGQAGKLLDKLLGEIAMDRKEVWICNVLKCRPPNNRDPHPNEIDACNDYLRRQVDLIEPTVICTLGNFSTKLLRADSTGISRLHGREEVRIVGPRAVRLYPLYHPAAALYTPSMLEALRADFHRIPELLSLGPPEQPHTVEPIPELQELEDEFDGAPTDTREPEAAAQLGLF
jgi:uracil-DNA glycosylase family 4